MTARSIVHAKQIKPAGATAKLAQNSALSARREKAFASSVATPVLACELGAKQTIFQDDSGGRLQSRLRGRLQKLQQNKKCKDEGEFSSKARRLKLEQMHMNVYIFKQVSPSSR